MVEPCRWIDGFGSKWERQSRRLAVLDTWQYPFAEDLDEAALVSADRMEDDLFHTELDELLDPCSMTQQIGRDKHGLPYVLGADQTGDTVEVRRAPEVSVYLAAGGVGSPLFKSGSLGLRLIRRVGEGSLEVDGFSLATAIPEGIG